MKTKLFSLGLIALTIFCACLPSCKNNESYLEYKTKPFECTLKITGDNTEYELDYLYGGNDCYTMTFFKPTELDGYSFTKKDGVVTLSSNGIAIPLKASPDGMFASIGEILFPQSSQIHKVSSIIQSGTELELIEYENELGSCLMYISKAQKYPLQIECTSDNASYSIVVGDFRFTENF